MPSKEYHKAPSTWTQVGPKQDTVYPSTKKATIRPTEALIFPNIEFRSAACRRAHALRSSLQDALLLRKVLLLCVGVVAPGALGEAADV